ncbi:DUF1905 domain-containing protein [Blastococcus sp. CT_GayMR19]|uniref:DUF1905 domain-containing protein n=1 Tax=Blastococcus sp. CT_GayMR19 TaxID=2559608 RepID=UPI001073B8F0|nr:DUF1905 domain-containing protein [Blastococcus sp. CT_GayMR19]TFV71950.1 DUF1905 domain-containing protein [Blastococcus sp. CT_GayMR19]
MEPAEFTSTPITTDRGHVRLPLPFDPRERWGKKPRHYVEGTIAGTPFAGSVGSAGGTAFLVLSAAFRKQAGSPPGTRSPCASCRGQGEQLSR